MFYKSLTTIVLLIILATLLIIVGILNYLSIINFSSNYITAIATVILAVITTWYVILTHKMLEETKKADGAKIYLDLEIYQNTLELNIGNTGKTSATDIKINLKENLELREKCNNLDKIKELFPIKNGISYLAPDRLFKFDIKGFDNSKIDENNSIIEFEIFYKDYLSNKNYLLYKLDLRQYEGSRISSFQNKSANTIANSIYSLERNLKLNTDNTKFLKISCPMCKELINRDAKKCPHCLEYISKEKDKK
ncbi:MAG: hypothetical protein A2513_00995 [Sulfurimonas sp. RIFOXYD12_FULL_33_39]|uniref:hypothetical protein n=1 Tax=unclassified Sulfurimonas TaxID=2623549 RepID=UPI0008BCB4AF|nr:MULTISPECIES: hypothetical protein [unclassified Sulfurimonas]OHE10897.1 MAG: hypothetical protein A2513_00995 [Sulfurimonas sp. RIFOXYD12_FULL_33_39]OHE13333.1 MAG: hypothetical protein A2530_07185 [Sulfurimonas sp. RIFOXYD2_FULL_34_21]